jgi:hypothetical protein
MLRIPAFTQVIRVLLFRPARIVAIASTGVLSIFINTARAVPIPYGDTPSAVVANNGQLYWDDQFASDIAFDQSEYDLSPQIIWVADFCHSGGFIDDLLSKTNTTFAAAAANWDETSTSAPTEPLTLTLPFHFTLTIPGVFIQNADVLPFGQTFMTNAATKDLGDSFAAASAAVVNNQTAELGVVGASAAQTLAYNPGDQAIIFSAGDSSNAFLQSSFQQDVQTTYNSLQTRNWAAGAINTIWDQGQNIPAQGTQVAVPVDSASTIANLKNAINSIYSNPHTTDSSKVFIYMNDHGTSTDQLLSKVTRNGNGTYHYSYQVTVSNYRINSPDSSSDYGVSKVEIGGGVPADAIMNENTAGLPGGWSISVDANDNLDIVANSETTATSWLTAGAPYSFSYDSYYPPSQDNWSTLTSTLSEAGEGISDLGVADGSPLGASPFVYNLSTPDFSIEDDGQTFYFYRDTTQVPGWDNGGNGWVEAPQVPEPSSFATVGGILLVVGLMARRFRFARAA